LGSIIPYGVNGCGTDLTSDRCGITRPRPEKGNRGIGAYEVAVVIDHQPPAISNVLATPSPTPPNAAVTLTATLDDGATGNSNIASAEYRVGDGAWMPMIAADGVFDSPLESATATRTFAQLGT
jgi:hypothetical protein